MNLKRMSDQEFLDTLEQEFIQETEQNNSNDY